MRLKMMPRSQIGMLAAWHDVPRVAFWRTWFIGFGLVNVLMLCEGNFTGGRYSSFLLNNGLFLPLLVALVARTYRYGNPRNRLYCHSLWHVACLVLPVAAWVLVDAPNFGAEEYFSPSKLAHTFSVALIAYWILAPLPALFGGPRRHSHVRARAYAFGGLLLACCLIAWGTDDVVQLFGGNTMPHVEWDWSSLTGTPAPEK